MNDVVSAFTEDQIERLAGITKSQLRYWDATDFFSPSLFAAERGEQFGRIYSFRDLVSLKVLNDLRNNAKVPLPQLREIKMRWEGMGDDLWLKQTLYAVNKRVVIKGDYGYEDALTKQGVLEIPMIDECETMKSNVSKLFGRDRSTVGKIVKQRNVSHNKPVIAGTRIMVKSIKAFAEAGYSAEQIQQEYPTLTTEDINAAIGYREIA